MFAVLLLYLCVCVWVCLSECVCVRVCLLFMTQYGRQAPRTCSLCHLLSLFRAQALVLRFCVGFMNYIDFYAVAYYFSLLFLFVFFFCFCSSAFFFPFLDFCSLLCRLAFFGCHKNVFLYVRRRYLAGRSSRHNVAPARLGLFSPAAAPYEYFCLACHWLLCSARLAFIILVYYIHIYIYSYIYICMCHVCVLHAHSFAVATHFELAAFVIFALISYFVCFLLPMPLPLLFIPHK